LKTSAEEWSEGGPYRFYFSEAYDRKNKRFTKPPRSATDIGNRDKDRKEANVYSDWPDVEPLATMDVFAGCGGN